MKRTALAQEFYPDQHQGVAGYILYGIVNDSTRFPDLYWQMRRTGYEPRQEGYSIVQVRIIRAYMARHPELRDIKEVAHYVKKPHLKKLIKY